MTNQFVITGLSVETGQLVAVVVVAVSEDAAKVKGEQDGLAFVTALPHPATDVPLA